MLNNESDAPVPAKMIRTTLLIFTAMVTGMALMMLVSLFIIQTTGPLMPALNASRDWLVWSAGIGSVAAFLWGRRLFQAALQTSKDSLKPFEQKLKDHRFALVRYLLIGDILVVVNSVLFIVEGDFLFQVYAAVIVGGMLAVTPIKRRIVKEFEPNGPHQNQIA